MTVINTVAAKAKAIGSGAASAGKSASSRDSARARLQLLGIGHGTITRFPAQLLPDVRLDNAEADATAAYPDISEIYMDLADKPAKWEKALDDYPLDSQGNDPQASESDQMAQTREFPSTSADTRALAVRRRRVAAEQLKHFHIFSGSLVAVLLCSAWMFGFAMFG